MAVDDKNSKTWLKKGLKILNDELHEQVLGDGGHFELSPMYHSIILEDILDILHLIGFYRVDSVLGFSAGQLGPDLFIFANMSCLRYLINSHEYAAVLEMDRQARSRTKTGDKAETWKRVRKYYVQCLKAMREREDRHKRVEEIRNDIQNLSLEVVRLENMQQKEEKGTVKQQKDEHSPRLIIGNSASWHNRYNPLF